MTIKVRLFGIFRIGRFKEELREHPDGATPRAVAEALGLPVHLLGTALIGGVHAGLDDRLRDGDELTLLPKMGGG